MEKIVYEEELYTKMFEDKDYIFYRKGSDRVDVFEDTSYVTLLIVEKEKANEHLPKTD